MKKLRLLFLLILALVVQWSFAEIQFGDGTSQKVEFPFSNGKYQSWAQSLYHKDDLQGGIISGIKIYYNGDASISHENIEIRVLETLENIVPQNSIIDHPEAKLAAYNKTIDLVAGEAGWITINFQNPIQVTGDNNIIIHLKHWSNNVLSPEIKNWTGHEVTPKITSWGADNNNLDKPGIYSSIRMDIILLGIEKIPFAKITGKVSDKKGKAVNGAVIRLNNDEKAITDQSGKYTISKVIPNTYNLSCHRQGMNSSFKNDITINANEEKEINFELGTPTITINPGQVTVTIAPNEFVKKNASLINSGDGNFKWYAEIEFIDGIKPLKECNLPEVKSIKKSKSPLISTGLVQNISPAQKTSPTDKGYLREHSIFGYKCTNPKGFGSFSSKNTNSFVSMISYGNNPFNGAGDFKLGTTNVIYTVNGDGQVCKIVLKPEGAERTFLGKLSFENEVTGLTTDPTTGKMYISTTANLYSFDPIEITATKIGSFGSGVNYIIDIACDKKGKMFGFDIFTDKLYAINKFTANVEEVGYIGFDSSYGQGLTYDWDSDQMIMSAVNVDKGNAFELRVVDTKTGNTAKIGDLAGQFAWIAYPYNAGRSFWLTLDNYSGNTLLTSTENLGINIDAYDCIPGEIRKAKIHIKSDAIVGIEKIIPVNMEIAGEAKSICKNLLASITDGVEGYVKLVWEYEKTKNFDHFKIYRNGEAIKTANVTNATDDLDDYGIYNYYVSAVFTDGSESSPAGPAEIVWLVPEICEYKTEFEEEVWENKFEYVYTTIKNCGDGQLGFEFPEFANNASKDFIAEIEPSSGVIYPGKEKTIRFKYNATDKTPGEYETQVVLTTNCNAPNNEISISHKMIVYTPSKIIGQIRDGNTNNKLPGVEVTAVSSTDTYTALTNDQGKYTLLADEDEYDLIFRKIGYKNEFESKVTTSVDNTITVDKKMFEMPYPPSFVVAAPNTNDPVDTECYIEWGKPRGPYEMLYDDGSAEDFVMGPGPGAAAAVRFTPKGYPCKVTGARIYVGDGSFPVDGNFIGSPIGIAICAEKDGLPGPAIQEKVFTIDNFGWVNFEKEFQVNIGKGDFFIVCKQMDAPISSAPIGVDKTVPVYYNSFALTDESGWETSAYQDLMIRAIVNGVTSSPDPSENPRPFRIVDNIPKNFVSNEKGIILENGKNKSMIIPRPELENSREVISYDLNRIDIINPEEDITDDPTVSVATKLAGNKFIDKNWKNLPKGYYAYKVRAIYTNGDKSEWIYSNIVGRDNYSVVTVNVKVTANNDDTPKDALVRLTGLDYPYEKFETRIKTDDGKVVFPKDAFNKEWFRQGRYTLEVYKVGYKPYIPEITYEIFSKKFTIDVVLQEKTYPVRDLYVDPLTSVATWTDPHVEALHEDFEGLNWPPKDWKTMSKGIGWKKGKIWEDKGWNIPTHDGYFVSTNDAEAGSNNDGSMDYLITPAVDLRESDNFNLFFDSYFDGKFGGKAQVEISFDGNNWKKLSEIKAEKKWIQQQLDLSIYSGEEKKMKKVYFAFHYNDQGKFADGWALDNIKVSNGIAKWKNFHVFLNDATQGSTTEFEWWYPNLQYGTKYTAAVAANYSSGLSKKDFYKFTSKWLIPPYQFKHELYKKEVILKWNTPREWVKGDDKEAPSGAIPGNLLGFKIYRNDLNDHIAFVEKDGSADYVYSDNANPGIYDYYISAVYDLSQYGKPAKQGESMLRGPININHSWGYELPFIEDWKDKTIDENKWDNQNNWKINIHEGKPKSCAQFDFNPLVKNYALGLTSNFINAVTNEVGRIWLDFDYKLDNAINNGEEKLLIQVKNFEGWTTVATYKNETQDNSDWIAQHINISKQSLGKVFQVRFLAQGKNSASIRSWYIDNIEIYHDCSDAPENIAITFKNHMENSNKDGIYLSWDHEDFIPSKDEWLHHDSQIKDDYFQLKGFSGPVYFGVKYSADELEQYKDGKLKSIRYIFGNGVSAASINIWKINDKEELILDQEIDMETVEYGIWVETEFNEAISIEDGASYLFTLKVESEKDQPTIGVDKGPGMNNKGDLISQDGQAWNSFNNSMPGSDINWNMGILVDYKEDKIKEKTFEYIIYRKNITANETEFYEIGSTSQQKYIDREHIPANNLNVGHTYKYKIKAFIRGSKSTCESDFSQEYEIAFEPVNLTEVGENFDLMVFPNPTSGMLTVKANKTITRLSLYNAVGQLISIKDIHSNSHLMDLNSCQAGIYLLKVDTQKGSMVKRISVK
ncbi:MAG: carboxypeptidase regulatory-like domain-containing protein [Bacteroidales bacterium]